MDTTVERSLVNATLDRLGQRAKAESLPRQAHEAAMHLLEAARLLEEASAAPGATMLFQGAAPQSRAG